MNQTAHHVDRFTLLAFRNKILQNNVTKITNEAANHFDLYMYAFNLLEIVSFINTGI